MLPKSLEYISCLAHLAVFGILGVSFQGFTHDSFQLSVRVMQGRPINFRGCRPFSKAFEIYFFYKFRDLFRYNFFNGQ